MLFENDLIFRLMIEAQQERQRKTLQGNKWQSALPDPEKAARHTQLWRALCKSIARLPDQIVRLAQALIEFHPLVRQPHAIE